MSSGWIFVTFCVLLRMVEGVGSAMFITAAFTLLPLLFPNSVGTMTVSNALSPEVGRGVMDSRSMHEEIGIRG